MSFPKFLILRTDSDDLNRVQDNAKKVLDAITAKSFLDGQILTGVLLKSGSANAVSHKLGRILVGWHIIRQRGPAQIYDTQDDHASPGLLLYLNTTADVVVDLLVF